jgi:hypothetical protein
MIPPGLGYMSAELCFADAGGAGRSTGATQDGKKLIGIASHYVQINPELHTLQQQQPAN